MRGRQLQHEARRAATLRAGCWLMGMCAAAQVFLETRSYACLRFTGWSVIKRVSLRLSEIPEPGCNT